MTSPGETWSPSLRCHFRRTPSVMVSESFSISRTWAMAVLSSFARNLGVAASGTGRRKPRLGLLQVEDFFHQLCRLFGVGTDAVFDLAVVRRRDLQAGEALDRVVQIVEASALDPVGDLGAHTRERPAFFEDHAAAGLLHRLEDEILVERAQGARIEHLG